MVKQKAVIRDVEFVLYMGERARGYLVSHPRLGINLIDTEKVTTSEVVKKYKNGNFMTKNTHYTVVKTVAQKGEVSCLTTIA